MLLTSTRLDLVTETGVTPTSGLVMVSSTQLNPVLGFSPVRGQLAQFQFLWMQNSGNWSSIAVFWLMQIFHISNYETKFQYFHVFT